MSQGYSDYGMLASASAVRAAHLEYWMNASPWTTTRACVFSSYPHLLRMKRVAQISNGIPQIKIKPP